MSIIANDKFERHPLLAYGEAPFQVQESLKNRFAALEGIFNEINKNLDAFCPLYSKENLREIRKKTLEQLEKRKSVEEVFSFTQKIAGILGQIRNDLQNIPPGKKGDERLSSVCENLDKIAQASDITLSQFKTDEEILKSTKFYKKTLVWVQNARFNLINEKKSQDHRYNALLKRLDDLEDKLKRKDEKTIFQFLDLVYNTIIDLEKTDMARMNDGNEGANESYYVFDTPERAERKEPAAKVGIFKPTEFANQVSKRQLASYIIDKINGSKANVPLTLQARSKNSKGTIQIFKNCLGSLFTLKDKDRKEFIDPTQLHYLTVHALRLWNGDANSTNVLWNLDQMGKQRLISIDQDECLPVFNSKSMFFAYSNAHIAWNYYPQMCMPFSEEVKKYIYALNPDREANYLIELGLPIETINLLKTVTWFIQEGAKEELLPAELRDHLLIGSAAKTEDTPLASLMIDAQNTLKSVYPDPIANGYALYSKDFEKLMKPLIASRVKQIVADIEEFGSDRRGGHVNL